MSFLVLGRGRRGRRVQFHGLVALEVREERADEDGAAGRRGEEHQPVLANVHDRRGSRPRGVLARARDDRERRRLAVSDTGPTAYFFFFAREGK